MDIASALSRTDWTIVDELHHIPCGRKGSLQEALRVEYSAYRRIHRQLGSALPPRAAFVQAIHNIRRRFPDFQPAYDAGFFFEQSRMGATLHDDPLAREVAAIAAAGGSDT